MQGTILKYDSETHKGFISGHDGNRYTFTKVDWTSDKAPMEGVTVDFEANDKEAKDIVLIKKTKEEKKKLHLLLFIFFLGWLGAHKFYLGETRQGWLYLLFFWTGLPALIAFFEFFYIAFMKEEAFEQKFNY